MAPAKAPPPGTTKEPWPAPSPGLKIAGQPCACDRCISCSQKAAGTYIAQFGLDAVRRATHVNLSVDKMARVPTPEVPVRVDSYHSNLEYEKTSFEIPSMYSTRGRTPKRPPRDYSNPRALCTSWHVPSMVAEPPVMKGRCSRPKSAAPLKGMSLATETMETDRARRGRLRIHAAKSSRNPMTSLTVPSMRVRSDRSAASCPDTFVTSAQRPPAASHKPRPGSAHEPNLSTFVHHRVKDPWLRQARRPVSGSSPNKLQYGTDFPPEMLTAIDPLRGPLRPSSAMSHAHEDHRRKNMKPGTQARVSGRNPDGTLTKAALKRMYGF